MGNKLFDAFEGTDVSTGSKSRDALFECQRQYGKLLREYKAEIDFIQEKLKELREERIKFYEEELPQIKNVLKEDDVLPEAQNKWIEEIKQSMNDSFQMSERLLNDFAIKEWDEFKSKLERI